MHPQRVVSLLDMVANISISALIHLMTEIDLQIKVAGHNKRYLASLVRYDPDDDPEARKAALQSIDCINHIEQLVEQLLKLMPSAHIERTMSSLKRHANKQDIMQWEQVFSSSCALRDTITTECREYMVYLYPKDASEGFRTWKEQWSVVVRKFPETEVDVFNAIDLHGLGHPTASIYHNMRVLEYGLGIICKHLCVDYSGRNWYNVINDIEAKIASMRRTLAKDVRAEVLNYYSTIAKEFSYFKDGWRNYASHARCYYDKHQAASVLQHVKSFMSYLAEGLPDQPHDQGVD